MNLFYGIEPTNDDLHIGSIYALEKVIQIAKRTNLGIVILFGTFTCKLGDPSDKATARNIKDQEFYSRNLIELQKIISKRIQNCKFVYNHDWMDKLSFNEYINLFGNISVNVLSKIKFFKNRLDKNLNLPLREFLYFSVQTYDFYYLNLHHNVIAQVGGVDQRNNMLWGLKMIPNVRVYTVPLITDNKGVAFSKTTHSTILNKGGFVLYDYIINLSDSILNKNGISFSEKHQLALSLNYLYIKKQFRLVVTTETEKNCLKQFLNKSGNEIIALIKDSFITKVLYKNQTYFYSYKKFNFIIRYI